ncbi:MAG: efflux RND transporter periplasmic adaptor subunit [Planctomycetota bacterium]
MTRYRTKAIVLCSIVLAGTGCEDNAFEPPPPPAVTVATPAQRDVVQYEQFTGTVDVETSVDVRARVSGIVQEVLFESGAEVRAGDPLFVIDPEPFVAARDAAQAQVESAEAHLRLTDATATRVERSARDGAISEVQALEARAKADAAKAAVTVAQRELAIKQLDVDYTDIRAPISGLIERSPYGVGDLVGNTADASLLTTIYNDSRVRVYFAVPDRVFLRAIRRAEPDQEPPGVDIGTEIDEGFPFVGQIDYADPTIDVETGTLQVRAVVNNEDRRLVDGLFVRVRLAVRTLEGAMLVPMTAIGADQVGSYVLVVDANGVVERREIELGPVDGSDRVVMSGLAPDDRVIVRGLLRASPGATVNPQPVGP